MIEFHATCPTLNGMLTLNAFGASRSGRALSSPIELQLLPGSVLGVVGPNGVGKSSLLSALAYAGVDGFGEVKRGSDDLGSMQARERATMVSMLAQDLHAPDELRVRELVAIGARASRRISLESAVSDALHEVGIADLASRRFGTLSGGQKQLAQIARVLAQDTPIVIFDEPSSALDLYHQRVVERILRRLGEEGKIVVAALHDLSLTLNACNQVLLLSGGGEFHIGAPAEVLRPELVHEAFRVHTSVHTAANGRRYLSVE